MRRSGLAVLAAALALVAAGCGGGHEAAPTSAARPAMTDLYGIDQLRTLFNAHRGEPRLVVLVSPT